MLDLSTIDNTWTLFLDRDGVINQEREPYVLTTDQFEFSQGSLEAIKIFSSIFKHVFIATNQRGVGRKMMTEETLKKIHEKMMEEIIHAGGKIEKIYYNIGTDNSDPNRKPNPGMALRALAEYPDISPERSIMVGNNISDLKFGRNAGFRTVLLTTTGTNLTLPDPLADLKYGSLLEFATALSVYRNPPAALS